MQPSVLGIITARGGSKSIPYKNIKLLAGKPLIAWTIEAVKKSKGIDRVIISTDDQQIAKISLECGAEVPFIRPTKLAQDDSPHIDVLIHAIRWLEKHDNDLPEYIMTLQPTSPLRSEKDIEEAIKIASNTSADAVVSVCETEHHPYLIKRILNDGTMIDFISSDIEYLRRQALPPAYAINGAIYLNRIESLRRDHTFLPKDTYAYVMPIERSLDINTEWDFYLTDLVMRNKNENTINQFS